LHFVYHFAIMQIATWGNSLAVRLPKSLVDDLGLAAGDQVEVVASRGSRKQPATLSVDVVSRKRDLLLAARAFRKAGTANFKFDREEANAR
jgi:antitoxin MazE